VVAPTRSAELPTSRQRSRWFGAWWPAIVWASLIFTLSSFSNVPAPPGAITDKHEHFVAYGILSACVLRGLSRATLAGVTGGTAVAATILTTMYGLTDELHQRFVPGREASWLDIGADAFGAASAAAAIWAWAIIRRRG
jgi:VanZ family protein